MYSKYPMKILCLDVGSKRIGVAASDPLGITAQPVATINRTVKKRDFEEVFKYIKSKNITRLIVGLPLDEDGNIGKQAKKVLKFVKELELFLKEKEYVIHVETWDERYSTADADAHLINLDVSRKKRRKIIDKMAAVMILKDYLESKRP
jgi:putative Holliday junction resolvase